MGHGRSSMFANDVGYLRHPEAARSASAVTNCAKLAAMTSAPQRQHPGQTPGGVVAQFFKHTTGAMVAVIGLFAVIAFMYFEGTANPQNHLNHVPVAIVNSDEGATIDTPAGPQRLEVGDQIVGGMMDQNDFSEVYIRVVDKETAEKGMDDAEFYGMVEFPADLSQRIGDLVTSTAGGEGAERAAERADINVYTAPRSSVTSSQVMNTLAGVLVDSVPQQVGEQVLDNGRLLAEAEQVELSPTAAAALADPVSINQLTYHALDGGVTNPSFPLFVALVMILAGFTGAMVVSQMIDSRLGFIPLDIGPFVHLAPLGTHPRRRVLIRKWVVTIIISPIISVLIAGIAHWIGVSAFPFWNLVLFSTLCILSVGFASHATIAIFGNAGLLINLLVFVVFGIPTSGGAIPSEMLPRWFEPIGQVEPMHAAVRATRAMLFTDSPWSSGLGHASVVLGVWLVLAVIFGYAVASYYDRRGYVREPNRFALPPLIARALGEDNRSGEDDSAARDGDDAAADADGSSTEASGETKVTVGAQKEVSAEDAWEDAREHHGDEWDGSPGERP